MIQYSGPQQPIRLKMDKGFTNKEMLQIVIKDLAEIKKIVYMTNGKVKFHTKMIYALAGGGLTITLALIGWLLTIAS